VKTKQEILTAVQEGLHAGVIAEADILPLLTPQAQLLSAQSPPEPAGSLETRPDKLAAVDIMFYIAGLVLFSALMSMIVQTWNDGSAVLHVLLSAGVGAGFWAIAYYLIRSRFQSDIRRGLINSLLLTGSLSIIVGGYIVENELVNGYAHINYLPFALTLALLAALHLGFDRLIRRDFLLLMGILLGVAAFPSLLFGILTGAETSINVWAAVLIASCGLLAYATRVAAKVYLERKNTARSYDDFAAFLALASMYAGGFGNYGIVWTGVLVMAIIGIFYLSIVTQHKQFLGNGSFFLVLIIITVSFKYFSGFGVTTSLIIATIGLLGTAGLATSINKKYFKQPALQTASSVVPAQPAPLKTSDESQIDSGQASDAAKPDSEVPKTEDLPKQ
jgi:MFS family permease